MDLKQRAETRLEAALAAAGLQDSRPGLRARLKHLKAEDDVAFREAVRRYEEEIVPALADGPAPLDAWLGFARMLGELCGAGRLVAVDASGRSVSFDGPYHPGSLVLYLPDDPTAPALEAALPQTLTAPQRATSDLLIHGRLGS